MKLRKANFPKQELNREFTQITTNDSRFYEDGEKTYEEIEKINSVDQAKELHSKIFIINRNEDFSFNYLPEQQNSNFDSYLYQITPITGTIVSIGAFGKELDNEMCEGKLDFYESFYKNKYKSKDKRKGRSLSGNM